jgi:hypothetical protein
VSALSERVGRQGLTIPLDQRLCFLHLDKQITIPNHSGRIPYLPTSFIKTGDTPDNCTLGHVRKVRDLVKGLQRRIQGGDQGAQHGDRRNQINAYHALCPFIHDFYESVFPLRDKLVVSDRMGILNRLDSLGNTVNNVQTLYRKQLLYDFTSAKMKNP